MNTLGIPKVTLDGANQRQASYTDIEGFNSLEELLTYLIEINAVLYYNGLLSYAEDIQFDFKTGEVYIPYISYKVYKEDTLTQRQKEILTKLYGDSYIRANYKLIKQTLVTFDKTTRQYSYSKSPIILLGNNQQGEKTLGILNIPDNLPLTSSPDASQDISPLFNLYLLASIKYRDKFSRKYVTPPKFVNKILNKESVPLYSEYISLPPFPSREYTGDVIARSGLINTDTISKPLSTYRTLYKCNLFFSIVNRTRWNNLTRGNVDKLLTHEHTFIKYKQGEICWVLTDDFYL